MIKQNLTGSWTFQDAGTEEWLPATVPGGVHTDLMALNRIPDPFVGENEKLVMWVAERDWIYLREFTPTSEMLSQYRIALICDGLDTLADIFLNSTLIGKTDNMFCQFSNDVTHVIHPGVNQIRIHFHSPVAYIRQQNAQRSLPGVAAGIPGSAYLRKAPCHFGWDWGPMLPPIGIWRDIRLEGYSTARLSDVNIQQSHISGSVDLSVAVQIEQFSQAPIHWRFRLIDPNGSLVAERSSETAGGTTQIHIDSPLLWWPNGYGEQPLYTLELTLYQLDTLLDSSNYQIGLRSIRLVQQADEWGTSFQFVINGVPVFIKGSNWIPPDSFPTRITPNRLEHLLQSAVLSNQNMLRVWGGGYYPEDRFYELCDRLGLLLWQDMMFACMVYPLQEAGFLQSVKIEIAQNVRRLRHHASIALWCGNNEIEEGWEHWGWDHTELTDLKQAYGQFFHHLLPEWIRREDPARPYWPSSPYTENPFTDTRSLKAGDAHYWEVWHDMKSFSAYREVLPRFMSEFGFQSLPDFQTIKSFTKPEDWNLTSPVMEHHQRGNHGNPLILTQMMDHFRLPKDFEALVYCSMVLQAEGIRLGIEHWRRNKHRVAGTIYWQLNDIWPGISWSSLDYYGRWKALHYAIQRAYAPVLLSLNDTADRIEIHITSDLLETWECTLNWEISQLDGTILSQGEIQAFIPPLESAIIGIIHPTLPNGQEREMVFVAELQHDNAFYSRQVLPFVPNKTMNYQNPQIQVELTSNGGLLEICLRANSLARYVSVGLNGADIIFSDNYFDLPAGRLQQITCPMPENWSFERARQSLQIRSLYDSY